MHTYIDKHTLLFTHSHKKILYSLMLSGNKTDCLIYG